jgi:hypothetical protein
LGGVYRVKERAPAGSGEGSEDLTPPTSSESTTTRKRAPSLRTRWMRAIGVSGLPTTTRAVAWAIGSHMDINGYAWLAAPTITKEAGLKDPRNTRRHVRALVSVRLLGVHPGGGRGYVNGYQAMIPDALSLVLKGGSSTPFTTPEGGLDRSQRRAGDVRKGGSTAPRSSTEVEKEGEQRW